VKILLKGAAMDKIQYSITIKPLSYFRQSEEVDREFVKKLSEEIKRHGYWTTPIPVERESGFIMDGNHRLCVAQMLGLNYIPCVLLEYSDPRISVHDWKSSEPIKIDWIIEQFESNLPMPYKTTRHRFNPPIPSSNISLQNLL
jgi:hypothetical protein